MGAVFHYTRIGERSGETDADRIVEVIWTARDAGRIVTAWPANRTIRSWYARRKEETANEHGSR